MKTELINSLSTLGDVMQRRNGLVAYPTVKVEIAMKATHLFVVSVVAITLFICMLFSALPVSAQDESDDASKGDGGSASDPLAKTDNTDLKWTYLDESGASTNLWWVKGSYSFASWFKMNYTS
jgi:hypothetical protein